VKRLRAVSHLFKRRVLENLIQVEECKSVNQVRRDMKRDEDAVSREVHGNSLGRLAELLKPYRPNPELIICFEG